MQVAFTPEQEALRDAVRNLLQDAGYPRRARQFIEGPEHFDRNLWNRMIRMGLTGLHVPEKLGGQGSSFLELVVVLEEMGAALACVPYLASTGLAATALLNCGGSRSSQLLAQIASGASVYSLAIVEGSDPWDPSALSTEVRPKAGNLYLYGSKVFVLDADVCDHILVVARMPQSSGKSGLGLFEVDIADPGLHMQVHRGIDATRTRATLEFDGAVAACVAEDVWISLEQTLAQAAIAVASECVGGARQCLESSVEYSKSRIQFDRPIGSFQAVKHRCADMLVDLESARSMVMYAGWLAGRGGENLSPIAQMTKAFCSDTFYKAAGDTIQIHGGIGYTWEHDAHLYFKRARASQAFLGSSSVSLDRAAGWLLEGGNLTAT